ncbi:helix-turn-helix domain-containing protein [Rhodococcus sp. MS16]|nr:helix-turn-helix domain-containing protein [Rhodococcus sp. MS16]
MQARSSLSEDQRAVAAALFEEGAGTHSVATQLGVSRDAVRNLHHRWLVRGRGASVTKPDKRSFSFDFKLEVVQRFLFCIGPRRRCWKLYVRAQRARRGGGFMLVTFSDPQ